jgi:capsular polysaccharide transport system ATP-binding protein
MNAFARQPPAAAPRSMEGVALRLAGVSKWFVSKEGRRFVVREANLDFPKGKSIALLGRNGAGKSTLLGMIAGAIQPDRGEIVLGGTVSWPVGFQGSFHADLTGAQNARFVARVYGVDTDGMIDFVDDFAELGPQLWKPLRTYSSGMRSRLAFAVSMAIRFDVYLVDEITAVGDAAFRKKSNAMFLDRVRDASAVYVSHSMGSVRKLCDAAVVSEGGYLTYYDDVGEGIAQHERNMKKPFDPRLAIG